MPILRRFAGDFQGAVFGATSLGGVSLSFSANVSQWSETKSGRTIEGADEPINPGSPETIIFTGRVAGPVGFEPTILGSEGPRLGPGSTTGPAAIPNLLALLLPWPMRLERGSRANTRNPPH